MEVEWTATVTRNGNEVAVGRYACHSFPQEQQPVAAARESKVGALKRLTHRPSWKSRIKVPNAVETDQTRKDPMPPDFVSAAHPRGVEVGGMPGVTVPVVRLTAAPRPPTTAESDHLNQHHCGTPYPPTCLPSCLPSPPPLQSSK